MKVTPNRIGRCLLCGLLLVPAGGCAVVSDVLSPNLLASLGIDPATVVAPQGVVIVAFNNQTQFPADFQAWEAKNARDLRQQSRNFVVHVEAGKQGNEVLDCPIGVISPGSLDATFAPQAQAVTVWTTSQGNTQSTQVAYAGQPLEVGTAFQCGDVIEITLVAAAAQQGGQQAFQLLVQVIR